MITELKNFRHQSWDRHVAGVSTTRHEMVIGREEGFPCFLTPVITEVCEEILERRVFQPRYVLSEWL